MEQGIKYLGGGGLSKDLSRSDNLNLSPLYQKIVNQLMHCNKFALSWFDCLAVIKMKILPKTLF